ncbi:MAG: CpaF family protein [Candidatus Hydrothermarchaeaceae archaeon]
MANVVLTGEGFEIVEDKGELVYNVKQQFKFSRDEKAFVNEVEDKAIRDIDITPTGMADARTKRGTLLSSIVKMIDEFIAFKGKGVIGSLSEDKKNAMAEYIANNMLGYGVIDPLLDDDNLEEVMIIGVNSPVYVAHRKHGTMPTNIAFEDDEEIQRIIEKIGRFTGRKIDLANPLLDARLPDGSRVNATLRPASLDGSTVTIRKFKAEALTMINIIKFGTLSTGVASFLWMAVDGLGVRPSNVLVSGGTGSGKTTTLNCLGLFVPKRDRVITIEDTAELQLPLAHKIRLETKPPNIEGKGGLNFNQLLINTLRMRPDRLILGEVRGEEAETLFVAMNTGHDGCMGTVHANSANETITRLINPPMNVPIIMMPALDLIIMQNRISVGGKIRRRITEIAEVSGIEMDKVLLNRIYVHDPKSDVVKDTGVPSRLTMEIAEKAGLEPKDVKVEMERRQIVLDYLVKKEITKLEEVYAWVQDYYLDEGKVLERIEKTL